jgi:membrane peptidoglycan carboxypeptidase
MAGAYATVANGGVVVPLHVVMQVKDANGTVLFTANTGGRQGVDAGIAADLTSALESVVDSGTGVAAKSLGYPVAGKTGTAGGCNGKNDGGGVCAAWFIGYTKQISTAVMYVAGADGAHDLNPYAPRSSSSFFGGGYPAQTWADYMKKAMTGLDKIKFGPPAYVNNGSPTPTPSDIPADIPLPPPPTDEPSAEAPPTTAPPAAPPPAPPTTGAPPTSAPPPPPTTPPPTTAPPPSDPAAVGT